MDTSDPLESGSYSGKLTGFSCDDPYGYQISQHMVGFTLPSDFNSPLDVLSQFQSPASVKANSAPGKAPQPRQPSGAGNCQFSRGE